MAKISGLGVKNLRALRDLSEPIKIAPITVLVGKNSVGKSTFARLFPLLRQSVERKKRSPILWYGDLVDFGDFSQAVTRGSSEIELTIVLEDVFESSNSNKLEGIYRFFASSYNENYSFKELTLKLRLVFNESLGVTFARQVEIIADGLVIVIDLKDDGGISSILINGKPLEAEDKILFKTEQGNILPEIIFLKRIENSVVGRNLFLRFNYKKDEAVNMIMKLLEMKNEEAEDIVQKITIGDKKIYDKSIKEVAKTHPSINEKILKNKEKYEELKFLLIPSVISSIVDTIDHEIERIAKGVRYIKPLRATAERYYRMADLSVAEIDPEGRNLAMFIDSLNKEQLKSFKNWFLENLAIEVETGKEGGQILLMAKAQNDPHMANVADMGFGISQILPIAAQLWAASYTGKNSFSATNFVVIEQPELHLHPAFQAKIADVLAGVVKRDVSSGSRSLRSRTSPPSLIVETHSQHLVNRLGQLIEEGKLTSADVSIVLFESDVNNQGTSCVRIASFDSEGLLQNWPYGFFDTDD